MNPLLLFFLSLACLQFAVVLVWVSNPVARVVWCIAALLGLARLLPALLMDEGIYLARHHKRYLHGRRLIEFAQKLSFLYKSHTESAPLLISYIELLQTHNQDALEQARKAMDLSLESDDWERKFRATSATGAAYFALKDYDKAAECLKTAWELYGSNNNQFDFKFLSDLKATIHAENLDMLGKISMADGNFAEAKGLFDRSIRTRHQRFVKGCAHAYAENIVGSFALAQGDVAAATERILCAAGMLPERLRWYDNRVAVDILCNLKRIHNKRCAEVFDELFKRYEPFFHAIDKQSFFAAESDQNMNGASINITETVMSIDNAEAVIPKVLLIVEERICKRLPFDTASAWQQRFRATIVGVDASPVWHEFVAWLLCDPENGLVKYTQDSVDKDVMELVSGLFRTGCTDRSEWRSASNAAEQAAKQHRTEASRLKSAGVSSSDKDQKLLTSSRKESDSSFVIKGFASRALAIAASAARDSLFGSANSSASIVDETAALFADATFDFRTEKIAWRTAQQSAILTMSEKLLELIDKAV